LQRARLIFNPWAARPATFLDLKVDRRELNLAKGRFIETQGRSLREMFDLPENWPE
jgi:hypothetical protein